MVCELINQLSLASSTLVGGGGGGDLCAICILVTGSASKVRELALKFFNDIIIIGVFIDRVIVAIIERNL